MNMKDTATKEPRVNPGYALFQIAKALTTSKQHEDPATRERAQVKISKWIDVFNGILNGTLDVGSRTPLEGVPGWVTLEVVTGGFATGELLASGSLLDHERALLAKLSPASDADGRRVLNGYYLTDEGLAHLQEQLHSGCYDISVPEEGALLVVAWLVENGHVEEARNLLDELAPYFSRLRFYPIPVERPRRFGSRVFLQDVGSTIQDLERIKANQHILAQKEAIQVWIPLYDQIVELFLETVKGESPSLRRGPTGERIPIQNAKFPIEGGWPCQNYPEGWHDRAQKVLDEYKSKRVEHTLCGKPDRIKNSFAQLRKYLHCCVEDPRSLSGRDVGRIRLILARYIAKRGMPGSSRWKQARNRQARQASAPTFHKVSRIVIPRLEAHPKESGIDNLDAIVQPITAKEAEQWEIEAGIPIPESQQRKIQRCLCETIDVLVERGMITSGEMLARVLPQMTSEVRAAGITDPILRQLYAAVYQAFRRRRSLLLLNLEGQIKIEELPWIAAIDRFRHNILSAQELAKQTLVEVTILTIVSFPHAILPNKLLQELRALANAAGLNLPLVDEIAADIFTGKFSTKFLQAAKRAAEMLQGTLYETYYGIDYREVKRIKIGKGKKSWFQRTTGDPFVELCSLKANVTYGGWNPVINGMIIEQQQILTSQNLAVLFDSLDLVNTLQGQFENLAQHCFIWICRRQQIETDNWHTRLITLKNTAYAWRQMIFFLALLPSIQVQIFLSWADEHLNEQGMAFQTRFRPALRGLALAAEGRPPDEQARRFLGWSKKRHWLLD
jgi:hypothetical protein